MADITLVNLNMLFMRYGEQVERELHVPLGCLYLARALEAAGFAVDFRDYQLCPYADPFDLEAFCAFCDEPAAVIGLSCMANLLPFTVLAARELRRHWPDRIIVLGGVGPKAVEQQVLERFGWIDAICRGEGERTGPELLGALMGRAARHPHPRPLSLGGRGEGAEQPRAAVPQQQQRQSQPRGGRAAVPQLRGVAGVSFRDGDGTIVHNPPRERIAEIDRIGYPAWEKIDLASYAGYGMMTSRGCPYPCTFCSVAPVWDMVSYSRSPASIVAEMAELHRRAGVDLFLFQDEFFVSGKGQVMQFCRELARAGLDVRWKAFGRVNLTDVEMMRAMADAGCVELRFGIESGSDAVLSRVRKGFTSAEVLDLVPQAVEIFPRVDAFYVWGFPFETLDDFRQTLFQMVSLRMMGARILPSLLSLLPQTRVYRETLDEGRRLEFCPWLLPEFVFTGHEVTRGGVVEVPPRYAEYFGLIADNPDIFPGFFHADLAGNVLPKLELLRQFGFYPEPEPAAADAAESCGAHSPRTG